MATEPHAQGEPHTAAQAVVPGAGIPDAFLGKLPEGGIAGAVIGVVGIVLWLRRKLSSDNKAIAADKGETSYLETLQTRLDATMRALDATQAERNALVLEVGGLRSAREYLTLENAQKQNRISALERRLRINDTSLGDLDETPPATPRTPPGRPPR